MTENTLLRLDKLELGNYRCFSGCKLDLHPELTVLVAENAGGKTAVLDALRLALLPFVTSVGRSRFCPGFLRSDMRGYPEIGALANSTGPTTFLAEGKIMGETMRWGRERTERQGSSQSTRKDIDLIRRSARKLTERVESESGDRGRDQNKTTLPVAAYYGTGRLYNERLTRAKRWFGISRHNRMSAYLDCLSPSSSYKSFSAWFGQRWEDIGESTSRAEGFEARPENQITAVREAVKVVLEPTGWVTMDWQPADQDDDGRTYGSGYIRVENGLEAKVPLYTQSDGIRNMVALVGDLAHRCVRLNPHFGGEAAYKTPGIVMIDEVDMHLHPRWQQLVIDLLHKAFPNVQFVMSTHSPHVLSTVDAKCIRVIEIDANGNGQTGRKLMQTQGDEIAGVLARVMEVDPVPDIEPAKWLSQYRELVQKGDEQTEIAQRLWNQLLGHFGAEHHLIQEAQILRRLQEFKRENKLE